MHFVSAKSILNPHGMNIYRGCAHGCVYCDSRSKCYQFTHDFEDIEVKQNAPELLQEALRKKRKRCMIGTGSMGDPYVPIEKELCLTRRCLEIIDRYNFGAALLTKSDLVLRDLDLLSSINKKTKAVVQMTLTTADDELCKVLEPGVCPTSRRVQVLRECKKLGIPTVVWLSPLLPFINDTQENIDAIFDYCDREYFYAALERAALRDQRFAGLKEIYQKTYGNNYVVSSPRERELMARLSRRCEENNIMLGTDSVFKWMEEFPAAAQDPMQPELF